MVITLDDVRHVARLSKLAINDAEAKQLQHELDAIIGYVKQLDNLPTDGLEPTYQVTGLRNVLRDDQIIDYGVSREQLLSNAPLQQDGQIKVRKVL